MKLTLMSVRVPLAMEAFLHAWIWWMVGVVTVSPGLQGYVVRRMWMNVRAVLVRMVDNVWMDPIHIPVTVLVCLLYFSKLR